MAPIICWLEFPKIHLASAQNPCLELARSQGKVRLGHMLPLVAWVTVGEQDRLGKLELYPQLPVPYQLKKGEAVPKRMEE